MRTLVPRRQAEMAMALTGTLLLAGQEAFSNRMAWGLPGAWWPDPHQPVASQEKATANGLHNSLGEIFFWIKLLFGIPYLPTPFEHAHGPALSYEDINLHHKFIAIIYQLLLLNG